MALLIEDHNCMISYAQLFKATDGFSSVSLIGVGSFGYVYKGVLNNGEKIVAVKVLNIEQTGASKSFVAECEALRSIRHRNLVKILTCCSSVDFEGNDFKALVYEFMPGGNLDSWLHPHGNSIQDEKEYGTGAGVSTYGDVYSYGILLLETFTKKQPTDEMFKDNFNIHYWVQMALRDGVMAVVDPSLLAMEEEKETTTIANNIRSKRCMKDRVQESLDLVIRIGVTCSAGSPWDRMAMNVVVKELQIIKDIYLEGGPQQKKDEP
ncbi:probable LRR receptor-like serine/threonine-protein kinase At3g47570 [Macadamia integrifolia]|uniref:probable LRR receptor-like serine/threonine-protein kinase At3g47570 n=1 Tax=Macadamia integrifolia TaxID=60698 RepID=UPI001C4F55CD|nr:probable LRR receptor-like serine/threonine-protein kinase At3g47570 [Macadamia integrifolia]